ncbi:unnamed protein product [Bursaphelenchus xylophilus]|uniref:(pine wood nematode) hypothetical protein n=1 Tax=Bursaphelenchus xylophilus TaxID=6326 RepID=A0A1I7RIP1_BURXY|nr:unnamed protein product [Bursaphelenchus xylophilus]CAG9118970.1 unnamed protein product [Bursaphelenchus xylophilus]
MIVRPLLIVLSTQLAVGYKVETEECVGFLNYSTPTSVEYMEAQWKFARSFSLTEADWVRALPTFDEVHELERLFTDLYDLEDFKKFDSSNVYETYSTLKFLNFHTIQNDQILIITEKFQEKASDNRFFGFVAIRGQRYVRNWIHLSSPHFETDGAVSQQASVLFDDTNAKTVVVAGAARDSVSGGVNSTCQPGNKIADAAHNTETWFHKILVAIWRANKQRDDQYIQWHGMAETSCRKSDAFLSVGANNDHHIYRDNGSFVFELEKSIDMVSENDSFAQTPYTDSRCHLVALSNVFGRIVNGVAIGKECSEKAVAENINGKFLHIEQKIISRCNLTLWNEGLKVVLNNTARANPESLFWSPIAAGLFTTLFNLIVL